MSICLFNFDSNPMCKTCSWNLFEVTKSDLKNVYWRLLLCSKAKER